MQRRGGSVQVTMLSTVAMFSFLAALAFGSVLWTDGTGETDTNVAWFIALIALVLVSLALIWKLNPASAAQVFTALSGVFLLLTGGIVLLGRDPSPPVKGLAGLGALCVIAGGAAWLRFRKKGGAFGNPLMVLAPPEKILEFDGLQFFPETGTTRFGGVLRLLIQNCFDAPRTLVVMLEPHAPKEQEERVTAIPIPALGVVRAELPVLVRSGAITVKLRLKSEGLGGQRRRTWEARAYENEPRLVTRMLVHSVGGAILGEAAILHFEAGPESGGALPQPTIVDVTQTNEVLAAVRATGGTTS